MFSVSLWMLQCSWFILKNGSYFWTNWRCCVSGERRAHSLVHKAGILNDGSMPKEKANEMESKHTAEGGGYYFFSTYYSLWIIIIITITIVVVLIVIIVIIIMVMIMIIIVLPITVMTVLVISILLYEKWFCFDSKLDTLNSQESSKRQRELATERIN